MRHECVLIIEYPKPSMEHLPERALWVYNYALFLRWLRGRLYGLLEDDRQLTARN